MVLASSSADLSVCWPSASRGGESGRGFLNNRLAFARAHRDESYVGVVGTVVGVLLAPYVQQEGSATGIPRLQVPPPHAVGSAGLPQDKMAFRREAAAVTKGPLNRIFFEYLNFEG